MPRSPVPTQTPGRGLSRGRGVFRAGAPALLAAALSLLAAGWLALRPSASLAAPAADPAPPDSHGKARAAPPPALSCKPIPPLEVALEALGPLSPGRVVRFWLRATPRVEAEEMRVRLAAAPAVAVQEGVANPRRSARKDDAADFEFAVRVPASGRHPLYVQVEITTPRGTVWRRGVGVGLGPNARAEAARVVPDGRGGQALDYAAAPAQATPGRDR